jgi:DNA polymerase-3 subunit alpha
VRVGGLLTTLRETRTRRGQRMGFATLEDLEGSFELVIFSEPFNQHLALLRTAIDGGEDGDGPVPLLITGSLESGDPPKILVRDILRLADAEEVLAARLQIALVEADVTHDRMLALKRVLGSHAGECEVLVHVTIPGESTTVLSLGDARGVKATDELCREVDTLFGRPVSEACV